MVDTTPLALITISAPDTIKSMGASCNIADIVPVNLSKRWAICIVIEITGYKDIRIRTSILNRVERLA